MKTALRFLLSVSCLAIFLTGVAAAHADTLTFYFTDYVPYFLSAGSGIITTVPDATIPNAFDVTGISGTVIGGTITGLLPCATYDPSNPCVSGGSGFFYDNLLYPDGTGISGITVLDFSGIGFAIGDSGLAGAFAAGGSHTYVLNLNTVGNNTFPASFNIALSPEPGSFVLLGTGLLSVAGAIRRRIRS